MNAPSIPRYALSRYVNAESALIEDESGEWMKAADVEAIFQPGVAYVACSWQLTETAPRDGTWILLGWFTCPGMTSMEVAFWHSTLNVWCQTHQAFTADRNWQPTHWMPLPDPPDVAT